jgi:hypothetical protein
LDLSRLSISLSFVTKVDQHSLFCFKYVNPENQGAMMWPKNIMLGSKYIAPTNQMAKRAIEEGRWYMKRARNTFYKQHEVCVSASLAPGVSY